MANFKLSLLTTLADESAHTFTRTTITDYVNNRNTRQKQNSSLPALALTYSEKLSLHQNSQKELSFSMLQKISINDDWVINPYVSKLHVGSLLELEDKYGHISLFIINKIAFAFKSINLEYQYTCQDAFTYQHSRQQSGYTITNDPSDDDYIGPKSLDWWVIRKIVPDCRIQYEYIPLEVGLYRDATGTLVRFTNEQRQYWDNATQRTIIKEPFTSIVDGVDEYQETFAFSCSNATASSALISLGDTLDLMVHVAEFRGSSSNYDRYFWFEPKENQQVAGIKYSPDHDISKFDLNFSGDSLTTVLNVNSNEVGDELVTLLPNTPGFFTQMFSDPAQWNKDLQYHPGFFTSANRMQYTFEPKTDGYDFPEGYVGVKLQSNFHVPAQFELFQFAWDENNYTILKFVKDDASLSISSNKASLYLLLKSNDDTVLLKEGTEIPVAFRGQDCDIYVALPLESGWTYSSGSVFFSFYHLFTDEEREFAEAAETCPWLENKLIDFSYFLKQGILTPREYSTLLSKFTNDLRLINGRLLYFTDAYYRALKSKVEILANMQSSIDGLHAQLEADVITPTRTGINKPDLTDFAVSYQTLFAPASHKTPILNYEELIADYFEKYLNAEQKFLKNIYSFRQYFNSLVSFSGNFVVVQNDISASVPALTDKTVYFLGLDKIPLAHGTGITYSGAVYRKLNNGHLKLEHLVNEDNYTNFYVAASNAQAFSALSDLQNYDYNYNSNDKYYLTQVKFNEYFPDQTGEGTYYDDQGVLYIQLSAEQLSRLILNTLPNKYYVRDTTRYVPLDYVRLDKYDIRTNVGWMAMPKLAAYWSAGESEWSNHTAAEMVNWDIDDKFIWEYYKSYFPLTSVYFYGPVYKTTETTQSDGKTLVSINRVNDKGWTQADIDAKSAAELGSSVISPADYQTYQAVTFIGGGYLILDWGKCSNMVTEDLALSLAKTFPYYPLYETPCYYSRHTTSTIESTKQNTSVLQAQEGDFWTVPNPTLGDSYYLNYGVDSTALIQAMRWTCDYYQAYQQLPSFTSLSNAPTWYKTVTFDDVIDTQSLDKTAAAGSQYFNYYKYAALSYSYRRPERYTDTKRALYTFFNRKDTSLFVKNKYLRALYPTDLVNLADTYVRIPVWGDTNATTWESPEDSGNTLAQDSRYVYALHNGIEPVADDTLFKSKADVNNLWTRRFSAITWYPFDKLKEVVSWTQDTNWKGATSIDLRTAISTSLKKGETIQSIGDNGLVVITTHNTVTGYIYCHVENYEKAIVTSALDQYVNPEDYEIKALTSSRSLSQVYNIKTDELITTTDIKNCLAGLKDVLYVLPGEARSFTQLTSAAALSDYARQQLYEKDADGNYNKVYSLEQLNDAAAQESWALLTPKELDTFYKIDQTHTIQATYSDDLSATSVELFACTLKPLEDETWELTSASLGYKTLSLSYDSATSVTEEYKGQTYTASIAVALQNRQDCSNMTNGQFWYKYHEKTEWQTLFEQAAAIETQLQTYWDQAYTASKYCQYYLPSAWQPYQDSNTNSFAKDIIIAGPNGSVSLSTKFVPEVAIYSDPANESTLTTFVNRHYLPKYDWVLASATESDLTYNTANENVLAKHDSDNYVDPSTLPLITNNRGIQQIMSHLKTDLSQWRVVKNGFMTYYYLVSGGMAWKDVPNYIGEDKTFELLDGQYGIFYYLLTQNYQTRSIAEYESLKRSQLQFWQNIHEQYPYLILEDNYSYSLATTSAELMQMAQQVFKGKKEPERNYSLTIIDTASLENYKGQELLPGQGILLDAYRYYTLDDDVYRALCQYLFISDVSYSLRDDTSIQLTVDSIKYQEKLLQSLVSLIK